MFFCIAQISVHAQSVSVKADRNQLLIGERVQYELLIDLPADGYVVNFKLPDTIPHFDVIENKNFDSISGNGSFQVRKKIIFTSFDSGAWHIPSFEVLLEKNSTITKLITDAVLINVGYSPADSTNQLRDIKPVMEVTVKDYSWYYIAAATFLLIIIIWLIYRVLKKRKKITMPVFHSHLSPYDEAMKSLQQLKQYDLDKPEQIKKYHIALSVIIRKYYSRKQSKSLMNKTTGDILIGIKEQWDNPGMVSLVAAALRCADAVKFAKYIPEISESNKNHDQVTEAIELIEKDRSLQKQ